MHLLEDVKSYNAEKTPRRCTQLNRSPPHCAPNFKASVIWQMPLADVLPLPVIAHGAPTNSQPLA